jgi:hypothetical protein
VPDTIDAARQMIESRLAELRDEAAQLERALAHLGEGSPRRRGRRGATPEASAAAPPPRKPKRRSTSKRKAGDRAARGERREQLLAAIAARPGARPSELAETIGIRPTQVSVLIAKARGEGLIVKSGKGYALKS